MKMLPLILAAGATSLGIGGLIATGIAAGEGNALARPAPASAVLAACPSAAKVGMALPPGARSFGKLTPNAVPLSNGSLDMEQPRYADPARGFSEDASDDVSASGATYGYGPGNDVSLMCRYGRGPLPLDAQVLVLIPLKPQFAICRFNAAKGKMPASMTCRRDPSP